MNYNMNCRTNFRMSYGRNILVNYDAAGTEAEEQAVKLCAVTSFRLNGYIPGVEQLCRMTGISSRPFVLQCLTRLKESGSLRNPGRDLSAAV